MNESSDKIESINDNNINNNKKLEDNLEEREDDEFEEIENEETEDLKKDKINKNKN